MDNNQNNYTSPFDSDGTNNSSNSVNHIDSATGNNASEGNSEYSKSDRQSFSSQAHQNSQYTHTSNSQYGYQNAASYPAQEKASKSKFLSKKGAAVAIVCCLLFSGIIGLFAGVFASQYYHDGSLSPKGPTTSKIHVSDSQNQNTVNEDVVQQGEVLSVKQIAARNQDAVVEIVTSSTTGGFFNQAVTQAGAGSGVIVTEDGYIATNYHVIEDTDSIYVRLHNGEQYEATVRAYDKTTDLAVIKIEATGLSTVTFGASSKLSVGDEVVAIGNPLGQLGGTVTDGIISATARNITMSDGNEMTLLQTNAAVNPGNSGGGLFNEYGELIGIVNAKNSGTGIEGLGYAIPSDTAYPVIIDLIESGYVRGRFTLGVEVLNILNQSTARYYGVSDLGVYISRVNDNGNAQRAGLKSGDYIAKVNDVKISDYSDLKSILESSSIGDTLNFEIKRNGETLQIPVTLNEDSNNGNIL